ncbi:alpha/beta fold hydrolase [Burkholderia gladioli]|uniref:alpha/beta fold hydrolase n=1 Tax=Burkholderia gladioli TaxID=28095 RepID=UPI003C7BD92E
MSTLTSYQTVSVADRRTGSALNLFYREAGQKDGPAVLLLHGFPTSSHQYRGLIERLADKYRVIAPDLPGFGFSDAPDAKTFGYTFDHLAEVIEIRRVAHVTGRGIPDRVIDKFVHGVEFAVQLVVLVGTDGRELRMVEKMFDGQGGARLRHFRVRLGQDATGWKLTGAAQQV